jgi:uncharacterized protein
MLVINSDDREPRKIPELSFRWIAGNFAICRLSATDPIPEWALRGTFTSVTRTAEELSIVALADNVPESCKPAIPWMCLKIEGPFAFSEVGILASFIQPLAENNIPVMAIATFDTDYVFIQEHFFGASIEALEGAGHKLLPQT